MYKMSSEAKRLTKERKITAETYFNNKTHIICMNKRGANDFYVIWVKMIDLQKKLGHRNACHVAIKKIKSFCKTKYPTKEQVKKYKRKANELGNDDNKSVYIREDLAYNLIHYIKLGVIETDESRKNLGITNNQSIRIERKMIVFEKENMVRQYQIHGLPNRVDICFVAHKLIIEIDEDGLGFTFIRINPDSNLDAGFDPNVEIAKIYNRISESSVKLALNSAEKSLKEKFTKELLSCMSSFSGILECVKYFIEKILPTLQK